MKISHKLLFSFLLVASLASVTMVFTLRSYTEINKNSTRLVVDSTRTIEILQNLRSAGQQIVSSTSELAFIAGESGGAAADRASAEDVASEEKQLTTYGYEPYDNGIRDYREMARTVCPEDANEAEIIGALGNNLVQTSREIVDLKKRGVKGPLITVKRHEFESGEASFLRYINSALATQATEQVDEQNNIQTSISLARRQNMLVWGVTFLLAAFSGVYISFLISRPISKLKKAIARVGDGELNTLVDITSKDEIGDLSRSFNVMIGDLKSSRAELAARERRFRAILEKSSDGVALITPDGVILYASPSTPRTMGYTVDEITGMNAAELIPPEDRAAFGEDLHKLASTPGASMSMVSRVLHKNGSMRWFEQTLTNLLDDPDIGAIVENYRDVTERKRAEEDSQRRQAQLMVLFDVMPAMIWFKDTENNILRVNKRVAEAAGLAVERIEGKPSLEIYPDEAAKFYADDLEVIRSGMPKLGYVEMLPDPDGHKRWVQTDKVPYFDRDGKSLGIVVMAQDVTERMHAEEALRESEEKFRELLENAHDVIYTVDIAGNFTSLNRAGEAISGYSRAEALQKCLSDIVAPESVAAVNTRLALNIQGIPLPNSELEIISKDGRRRTMEVNSRLIKQNGVPVGLQGIGRDITERKRADEETTRLNAEIEDHRECLKTMIANIQGVVWESKTKIKDGEAILDLEYVSDYIETMIGYTAAECLGNPRFWLDILHPGDRKRTEHGVRSIFAGGKGGTLEFRWIAKDGRVVWVESRNEIIRDDDRKAIGLRGIVVDITERKSLEKQLTHQALHDPLTKLGNRVLFRDRVEHAINRTRRKHAPIAVLFLDLDNFKSVNDSLGHAAGDELLVSVTERLQACLRTSDTPARLGGDEFAVLLEDLEHADQASFIAERLRTVLRTPFSIAHTEVFIGSSIGIAITVDGRVTPEELLRNADVAMYMSKSNGKDRYTVFENEMHDALIKRVRLESDMRAAIDNKEFEVYYQPIIDLDSEAVMGMEALVRWNHPEHGLIPPLDFIPLAEETGLIVPLGKWILEQACTQAAAWQSEYGFGADLSITINVASRQFQDDSLFKIIEHALVISGLPPRSLILEITESTMLSNTESTISKLNELKELGIRFAIDDFGTGYSSLSYLQRFPVDILKIDKSFIDKIATDKEGAAVAKAIITMSETLSLKTIAEGIESGAQRSELQKLGCGLGQGFHFARPLRVADMNKFIRHSLEKDDTLPIISMLANSHASKAAATLR